MTGTPRAALRGGWDLHPRSQGHCRGGGGYRGSRSGMWNDTLPQLLVGASLETAHGAAHNVPVPFPRRRIFQQMRRKSLALALNWIVQ